MVQELQVLQVLQMLDPPLWHVENKSRRSEGSLQVAFGLTYDNADYGQ